MTKAGFNKYIYISSLLWLWILLIVLVSLIVIGGVGYFVYMKFFKRTPYILDSAKVSLMEK